MYQNLTKVLLLAFLSKLPRCSTSGLVPYDVAGVSAVNTQHLVAARTHVKPSKFVVCGGIFIGWLGVFFGCVGGVVGLFTPENVTIRFFLKNALPSL